MSCRVIVYRAFRSALTFENVYIFVYMINYARLNIHTSTYIIIVYRACRSALIYIYICFKYFCFQYTADIGLALYTMTLQSVYNDSTVYVFIYMYVYNFTVDALYTRMCTLYSVYRAFTVESLYTEL